MRKTILLSLAVLAGCAPSPGYRESPISVPAQFREQVGSSAIVSPPAPAVSRPAGEAASVPSPQDFWQTLGDTTLNRLLEEVSRQNLDLRGAQARVSGARASRERALLDLTPTLGFNGGYARQRLSSASFPQSGGVFERR